MDIESLYQCGTTNTLSKKSFCSLHSNCNVYICVIVTLHVKEQGGATFVFVTEDLQHLISLFNNLLLIKSVQNKPQYSEN